MVYVICIYLGLCSQVFLLKAFGLINLGLIGWAILTPVLLYISIWTGSLLWQMYGPNPEAKEEE